MYVRSQSLQSCPTLCDPTDCSPPGSSPWDSPGTNTAVGCHGLLSRGFSPPRDQTHVSCIPAFTGRFFTTSVTCKFHRVVKMLVSLFPFLPREEERPTGERKKRTSMSLFSLGPACPQRLCHSLRTQCRFSFRGSIPAGAILPPPNGY